MRRRAVLAWLGALAAAAATPRSVDAAEKAVRRVDGAPDGVTLELRPKAAPYPTKTGAYEDATVLVFVPRHFRLAKSKRVDFVVHFHGHTTTAKDAIVAHHLREQVRASRQNAVLVVPQGPVRAADGDFGKLMQRGGLGRLLAEVIELAKSADASDALGDAALDGAKSVGKVVLSAHSGGYRAAAACVGHGGVDVREVYLFDALYGELPAFRAFVLGAPERHKLVSYYVGGRPRELSLELSRQLEAKKVRVLRERDGKRISREELVKGRAIFLEGHATHATATWEEQALRDCLFASCLTGRGSRDWHEDKDAPRAT